MAYRPPHTQMRAPRINGEVMCHVPATQIRRPPARRSTLPLWMADFAVPCAVACAAVVGFPICMGVATLLYFSTGSPQGSGLALDLSASAVADPNGPLTQLTTVVLALRQDIQRQDNERHSWGAALEARLGRLERSAAMGSRSVAGPSVDNAISAQSVFEGVDWASMPSGAEIDVAHTSEGIGRDLLGRAWSGLVALVRQQQHVADVSFPSDVLLATDDAPAVRCFSFRGSGSVAIRFSGPVVPSHVVVEVAPSWARLHPKAAPRGIEAFGLTGEDNAEAYVLRLGEFEYQMQGASAQAFRVDADAAVRGVKFVFRENWGAEHTSVCRLRVFAPLGS